MSNAQWIGTSDVEWTEPEQVAVHVSADIGRTLSENPDALVSRVEDLRKGLNQDHSVVLPPVRFTDYPTLRGATFEIYVRGAVVWLEVSPEETCFLSRLIEVLQYLAVKHADRLQGSFDLASPAV